MERTVLALLAFITAAASAPAQHVPSDELNRRAIHRRAVEAVIWGMPAVNYELMLQAMLKAGGKENEIVYWSRPLDWRNQTLTPNPDTIYLMLFFNTKNGPVVIDVPPAGEDGSFAANIDDIWQMPLEDAGPAGADRGAGGKYLVVPPDHTGPIPEGYIVLRSRTYGGYALFRSALRSHSGADVAKAVAYGKRLRIYALADAASPLETKFTDAADLLFDSTIPYDLRFFESLHRIVQSEPWLERDRAMIDQLKTLGIEKGRPFAPNENTKRLLEAGIDEARAWLDTRYEAAFAPFFRSSRWALPVSQELLADIQSGYANPNQYAVDARGLTYTFGFIGIKRLGGGQFYLMTIRDKDGAALDGGKSYRLTVPPNAPIEQYWSVTAYDRETHALVRNMARASRASNASDVQKNADGSVDIYFGPSAPAGKETNWVPTDPQRGFELMVRLYGPTKALFEKAWVLPDVERIPAQ
jgi:hypothetical protein